MTENNLNMILQNINAAIVEIQRSNAKIHDKISTLDEKMRFEINKNIGDVHDRIDRIEQQKLDAKEFEPYKSFFQKVNRLIRAILISAIV